MFHAKTIATAGVIATLMTGTAHAAITADQIWAAWQENAATAGLSLVAESKTTDGDVTTLTGITIKESVSSGLDIEGSIAEITMTNDADGTVTIAFAPEFTVPLPFGTEEGTFTVTHDNMTLTAREADGGTAYDYAGASLTIATDFAYQAEALDGSGPQDASVDATFSFVNPVGTYTDMPGTNRKINIVHASDSLDYTMVKVDPTMGTNTDQDGSLSDVKLTYAMTLPGSLRISEIESGADFSRALTEGLTIGLQMSQGVTEQTIKAEDMFLSYEAKLSYQPGSGSFAIDKTGGRIEATNGAMVADITSPSFPFPALHMEMSGLAMDFRMPLTGTDAVPFRYMIKLNDLTVNEEAWAVVDPGTVLPRDPATIALDLTGMAAMDLGAVMDSSETGGAPNPLPSIETLDIADLKLAVAGALMTGTGAFTFDNATGTPMPRGAADVSLTGGNALIDGLVAIGVLPEEQAASARMMMSMFMTPGADADTMTSKIEARDDGGIYVNGQRVQ